MNKEEKTKAIAKRDEASLEKARWELDRMKAHDYFKSGMFPNLKSVYGAITVIAYGKELKIKDVTAMQSMAIISGKVCIASQAMLYLFQKNGGTIKIVKKDKAGSQVKFSKKGHEPWTESFTMEDAKRIEVYDKSVGGNVPLADRNTYKNYPEEMCYWRCISKGIRACDPGCIAGLYTPEEMQDVSYAEVSDVQEREEVIEAEIVQEEKKKKTDEKVVKKQADKTLEKMGITAEEEEAFEQRLEEEIVEDNETKEYPPGKSPAEMASPDEEEAELPFDQQADALDHKKLAQRLNKELGMAGLNAKELADFKLWLTIYQDKRKPKRQYIGVGEDNKPHFMLGKLEHMKELEKNLQVAIETWRADVSEG